MNQLDKDLYSVQEVRQLIRSAKEAQKILEEMNQEQIDKIVKAIADAGYKNAELLAKMAHEETGFGKWEDKTIKNIFSSKMVYETLKNEKTVGIINEDKAKNIIEIAVPVGVVGAIIPSTNPTSTVIYKAMIALKAGNAIVISPHPGAKNCILRTANIIKRAAVEAGCPEGAIGCITTPTLVATTELMKHDDTALILATGGGAMVKAAYSSGTPAIGVGAGNGPAFIDKSADVKLAVKRIMDSKTFDNGTICASEQSIIVEKSMEEPVISELKRQGAYILNDIEKAKLGKFIMRESGTMNPKIVGKSVSDIANLADLTTIPPDARVLVARESEVGKHVPFSKEKLSPILAFYVEDNEEKVLEKSRQILIFEGKGHTYCMHTKDEEQIKRFGLKIPASRILINTPAALGGIGGTTNLLPALTLGCGAIGGSSTSNNVGPLDLINIKRVASGVRELEDIREVAPCKAAKDTYYTCNEDLVTMVVEKVLQRLI